MLAPLRKILQTLSELNFSGDAGTRLEDFASGLTSIDQLQQTLHGFVRNHDCLHAMDDQLALFDNDELAAPSRIRNEFRLIEKRRCRLLVAITGSWNSMKSAAESLQEALDSEQTATDSARWERTVRQRFRKFRSQVTDAFNQTDYDLNSLCEKLGEFGYEVTRALNEMKE